MQAGYLLDGLPTCRKAIHRATMQLGTESNPRKDLHGLQSSAKRPSRPPVPSQTPFSSRLPFPSHPLFFSRPPSSFNSSFSVSICQSPLHPHPPPPTVQFGFSLSSESFSPRLTLSYPPLVLAGVCNGLLSYRPSLITCPFVSSMIWISSQLPL